MSAQWGIIVALLVEGAREKRGPDWCRKWSVGFARRRIGAPVRSLPETTEDFATRVRAAEELRTICRRCGACKLCGE
jgi:hypothetical protein